MASSGVRILPSVANTTSPKSQISPIISLPSPSSPSLEEISGTLTTSPTMASINNASTSEAKHICPECSRRFGRAEHLERHIKVHLPSNASRSFICECCFKGFTRKDVLTRHIRAVHESKKSDVKKSRRRSCKRCAGFKIKCTGGKRGPPKDGVQDGEGIKAEEACDACKKRGVECTFDFGSVSSGNHDAHESEMNGNGCDRMDDGVTGVGNFLDFPSDYASADSENEGEGGAGSRRTSHTSSGVSKRRKTLNGYSTEFIGSPAIDANSTPKSGNGPAVFQGSAPSLRKLIGVNAEQPPGLATADHLISLMTTKTYEHATANSSAANSTVNSNRHTPEKAPSSASNSTYTLDNHHNPSLNSLFLGISTDKSHQQRNTPLSTADLTPRSGLLQSPPLHTQKEVQITGSSSFHLCPSIPRARSPGSLLDAVSHAIRVHPNFRGDDLTQDEREYLDAATGLQGMSNWSPPKNNSPPPPNVRKSMNINSFVQDTPGMQQEAGGLPGILPPISFDVNLSYESQFNQAMPAPGIPGLTMAEVNMVSNADTEKLQQDTEMMGDGLADFGGEDNWFFDFGMFDNSTDWLRDWGDDSSSKDINTNITSDASYIMPPSERTASSVSSGPTAATPKDFPSPRVTVLDGSAAVYPNIKPLGTAVDESQNRPTPSSKIDPTGNNDFLPWTWSSSPREERKSTVTLPPFSQLLEDCVTPGDKLSQQRRYSYPDVPVPDFIPPHHVSDKARQNMIALLSLPHTKCPYDKANALEFNSNKFPTTKMIHEFIDLYFKNFHAIIPMIHKPTFTLEKSPTIILVAMASIGASYSKMEGSKVYANMLSELCKKTLAWMAEHDGDSARTPFYLAALCLQNVYALGSGSHRLYDYADVSRSFLIGNARRTGLFCGTSSPPPSSSPSAPGSPTISNTNQRYCPFTCEELFFQASPEEVEAQWAQWRKKEEFKRLAWAIFEYDCSFSTLSNRRGAITLNDISTRMPCSEALWEAPNAQAWKSIVASEYSSMSIPSKALVLKGLPFYPTLKDLIAGKVQAETLNSWGKRLCAGAIGRILWDFKELEESVLSVGGTDPIGDENGLGLPMLSPGFKPAKEKLLKTLMGITECIKEQHWEKKSGRDSELGHVHLMLSCLTSHYSHLHAAFPTISTILSLARRPPPASQSSQVDPRITRLKCIFSSDPIYARTLAWHAAQIIALSRWRPICSPIEGMRIFVAGVVLWGFGRYFRVFTPSPGRDVESQASSLTSSPLLKSQEEVVRLDLLPWTVGINTYNSPSGIKAPDEWIRSGKGKATIGKGSDSLREDGSVMTEICSENGAREVLKVVAGILGRMKVWGLGGEFQNVLEEMGSRN
ncbi:hypothetical protein RUND412_008163 [Rhizina undulata]